ADPARGTAKGGAGKFRPVHRRETGPGRHWRVGPAGHRASPRDRRPDSGPERL
ncbi:uncharacterized protein METZ01_LOCUS354111, partial [marine metagenome]